MSVESEILRIPEFDGFPATEEMAFGCLTDEHRSWIPDGAWRGAIVWGLPLPDDVVNELEHGPTSRYAKTYRDWNLRLNKIAKEAEGRLRARGVQAHAVPASKVVEHDSQRAEASHRHLAAALGMGWIGRHGLLVTVKWGPALRLVTVLVDHPVEPSPKIAFGGCGSCMECVETCPVNALEPPIDAKKLTRCWKLLRRYERDPAIGSQVCGVCIKTCRDAINKGYNDTGKL